MKKKLKILILGALLSAAFLSFNSLNQPVFAWEEDSPYFVEVNQMLSSQFFTAGMTPKIETYYKNMGIHDFNYSIAGPKLPNVPFKNVRKSNVFITEDSTIETTTPYDHNDPKSQTFRRDFIMGGESNHILESGFSAIYNSVNSKIENSQNASIFLGKNNAINNASGTIVLAGENNIIDGENNAILNGRNTNITGSGNIAIGGESTITANNSMALMGGSVVNADNAFAFGLNSSATIADSLALGSNSITMAADPTAHLYELGGTHFNFDRRDDFGVVSFGSETGTRTLQNISPGKISPTSHDAVNGSQLYDISQDLQSKIKNSKGEAMSSGAHAAALAALKPLDYNPYEKAQIMAGIGRYKHHNAYALGVAYHANENLLLNGGVSVGKGNPAMINGGITWRVGREKYLRDLPILHDGPISAVYRMARVLENLKEKDIKLEAENKALQEKVTNLETQIQEINAKLNELISK